MKTKIILINIVRFILLLLMQVFIFNKINLGGYLNPMVYTLFILLLPFEISGFALLMLAFFMGLGVDMFVGSIGLHAGASVFMAFFRTIGLRIISSNREYESGISPGINDLGYVWFIKYTMLLVFAHHLYFFFMEAFTLADFGETMARVLISSIFSIILILFIDIIFKPNIGRR